MALVLSSIQVDLMTLLYVVLALMGVAVLVTLLILLIKAIKAVDSVNDLLKDVKPDIKETTEKLPELMEHATIISGNVVDVTDSVAITVPAIMEKITPKKKPKQKTKTAENVVSSAVVNALVLLLTRWGHRAHATGRGDDGVRLIEETAPDVALVDIGLPDAPGYEVARAARAELELEARARDESHSDRRGLRVESGLVDLGPRPRGHLALVDAMQREPRRRGVRPVAQRGCGEQRVLDRQVETRPDRGGHHASAKDRHASTVVAAARPVRRGGPGPSAGPCTR